MRQRTFLETLEVYNNLKEKLEQSLLYYQELEELGGFPKTGASEGMPKAPSRDCAVERLAIKLAELKEEQESLERSMECLRIDMAHLMGRVLNKSERSIVEQRIFVHRSWEAITRKTKYSYGHVRHIYSGAIKKLQESAMYEVGKDN